MPERDPQELEQEEAKEALVAERESLLERLHGWFETPMLVLGVLWLLLIIIELGLEETWAAWPLLGFFRDAIWALFVVQFLVELLLAPRRWAYLRGNWLTAVALFVPALRMVRLARVVRAARVLRGVRLLRVVSSLNRGMRALGKTLGRRGFGYVVAMTTLVTFGGAAGIYAFEKGAGSGIESYPEALWWTTMLMTTMGSRDWPVTPEGRLLCVLLALYAFAIFGYVTATLATHFVGRDVEEDERDRGTAVALDALRQEVAALRLALEPGRPLEGASVSGTGVPVARAGEEPP